MANDNGRGGKANEIDHAAALDATLATRFIRGANKRFKTYLSELRNSALNGNMDYPENLTQAYNIMQRRSEAAAPVVDGDTEGIAFVTAGRNGRVYHHITCLNCGMIGHYQDQCPEIRADTEAQAGTEAEGEVFTSSVDDRHNIPASWILLDSEANVDLICNSKLLRNIRRVNRFLTVHCNAGSRRTNLMGDLPGYPMPVWYSRHAIANILSLCNVKNIPRWRVTYSSSEGDEFRVTKDDGSLVVFGCSDGKDGPSGLYRHIVDKSGLTGVALVNTVAANKSRFTLEEVSRAEQARFIQKVIGRPSTRDYIRYITRNQLPNCPVTRVDIANAENIFGPDVGSLKGKTTRQAPPKVRVPRSLLPPEELDRHRDVTLCADLMHINGVPFLISVSRKIKFGTVEELRSASKDNVLKAFDRIRATYSAGGLRVRHALMDGYFESYRADLAERETVLNTTGRDEHVGDIERYIRTIKERARSTYNTIPFKRVPPRMVIEMVKQAVFWRNSFPPEDGISDGLSPRAIITGIGIDFNRHCKFEFGEYVQTHEEHDNSMGARTVGAIAMRPTGNLQGSHYFFSLATGRILNRTRATKLPMPSEVIDRVHTLARRQGANRGRLFGDRHGGALPDGDDNEEYDDGDDSTYASGDSSGNDDDGDDDDDDDNEPANIYPPPLEDHPDPNGVPNDGANVHEDEGENGDGPDDCDSLPDDEGNTGVRNPSPDDEGSTGVHNEDTDGSTGVPSDAADPDETTEVHDAQAKEDSVDEQVALEAEMDGRYGPRSGEYNLRERRRPNYSLVNAESEHQQSEDVLATPQMNMKKGIKEFGEQGVAAVKKEMNQLHDRKVMTPRHKMELTAEQRREALAYLMFLKRKRCGTIKGRGCADGRKQRAWTNPEDAASPTVSTEAVFLTAMTDAIENREVAVIDIPGAFMQADMDELVHVRFNGRMAELLVEIDPRLYMPYITYEKGQMVLYVELLKALYGTLRAARLFWEKLSKTLMEWGFQANPYDSCVMNKMVNGKQLTVAWHVDDLKISHVDCTAVDHFINQVDEAFGKEAPLSRSRGKVHDYLGMVLDFSKPGELSVTMIDYIKMVLADVPEEMRGRAVTPAAEHLFKVNDTNPVPLDEERGKTFHRVVMQMQYLSQRARPDIRTAISFLCKRVTKSDEDDWKKLTRVTKYLDSTVDLPLRLTTDGSGNLYWYVDASFGVHHDMKGHTGGTLTMGGGSIYSASSAQKIVARSSTEAELIGVHDVMPQMLWTLRFLEGQGSKVNGTILYQDNMSAMLLEKNGRASSSKRTRHILLRYYFVKEHVDSGTVEIKHCPTKEMWGDYFTKPTQGSLFYKLRDDIMNIDSSSPYHSSHRSVLRVECDPNVSVSRVIVTNVLEEEDAAVAASPHSL